jgi:hypothetical protein
MNPNYLINEEVEYILRTRGIQSDVDLHLLRKFFGSVMSVAIPIKFENLGEVNLQGLWWTISFNRAYDNVCVCFLTFH